MNRVIFNVSKFFKCFLACLPNYKVNTNIIRISIIFFILFFSIVSIADMIIIDSISLFILNNRVYMIYILFSFFTLLFIAISVLLNRILQKKFLWQFFIKNTAIKRIWYNIQNTCYDLIIIGCRNQKLQKSLQEIEVLRDKLQKFANDHQDRFRTNSILKLDINFYQIKREELLNIFNDCPLLKDSSLSQILKEKILMHIFIKHFNLFIHFVNSQKLSMFLKNIILIAYYKALFIGNQQKTKHSKSKIHDLVFYFNKIRLYCLNKVLLFRIKPSPSFSHYNKLSIKEELFVGYFNSNNRVLSFTNILLDILAIDGQNIPYLQELFSNEQYHINNSWVIYTENSVQKLSTNIDNFQIRLKNLMLELGFIDDNKEFLKIFEFMKILIKNPNDLNKLVELSGNQKLCMSLMQQFNNGENIYKKDWVRHYKLFFDKYLIANQLKAKNHFFREKIINFNENIISCYLVEEKMTIVMQNLKKLNILGVKLKLNIEKLCSLINCDNKILQKICQDSQDSALIALQKQFVLSNAMMEKVMKIFEDHSEYNIRYALLRNFLFHEYHQNIAVILKLLINEIDQVIQFLYIDRLNENIPDFLLQILQNSQKLANFNLRFVETKKQYNENAIKIFLEDLSTIALFYKNLSLDHDSLLQYLESFNDKYVKYPAQLNNLLNIDSHIMTKNQYEHEKYLDKENFLYSILDNVFVKILKNYENKIKILQEDCDRYKSYALSFKIMNSTYSQCREILYIRFFMHLINKLITSYCEKSNQDFNYHNVISNIQIYIDSTNEDIDCYYLKDLKIAMQEILDKIKNNAKQKFAVISKNIFHDLTRQRQVLQQNISLSINKIMDSILYNKSLIDILPIELNNILENFWNDLMKLLNSDDDEFDTDLNMLSACNTREQINTKLEMFKIFKFYEESNQKFLMQKNTELQSLKSEKKKLLLIFKNIKNDIKDISNLRQEIDEAQEKFAKNYTLSVLFDFCSKTFYEQYIKHKHNPFMQCVRSANFNTRSKEIIAAK